MSVPQTLDDLGEIAGQIALVRVDFNVPIGNDGAVGDDTRLRASLPTVMALRRRGSVILLLSHLGRPKGKPNAAFSLAPVAKTYSSLLGDEVHFLEDWTGPGAQRAVSELEAGDVVAVVVAAFALSLVATLYPAWRAARIAPSKYLCRRFCLLEAPDLVPIRARFLSGGISLSLSTSLVFGVRLGRRPGDASDAYGDRPTQ